MKHQNDRLGELLVSMGFSSLKTKISTLFSPFSFIFIENHINFFKNAFF